MIDLLHKPKVAFLDKKPAKAIDKLNALIMALNKKEMPDDLTDHINKEIKRINQLLENEMIKAKEINKVYQKILKLVREKTGFVPKNYYKNLWMVLGLAVFGAPLGIVFSMIIRGDAALMGIYIGLGLPLGLVIGGGLDKKAAREGKQLDT